MAIVRSNELGSIGRYKAQMVTVTPEQVATNEELFEVDPSIHSVVSIISANPVDQYVPTFNPITRKVRGNTTTVTRTMSFVVLGS